jgi:two-component system sensor histidine kinase KdpD
MARSIFSQAGLSQAGKLTGQIAVGSLGVALITLLCFKAHLDYAIPAFLYLLLVVLQSLWSGFATSATVSVIAAACLEYFFIPPVLEWQINDPEDGLALAMYLVTSLIITRLASKARNEARIADRRRKDSGMLYETAARLLSLEPETAAGPVSLQIFREVFGLRAACIFDAESAKLSMKG